MKYDYFPEDPKKLKARIRSYMKKLKADPHDGYGKRFLVSPMYLLLGDIEGALEYYRWYENAYPDDSGEPINHLCWALSLFKAERKEEAREKLRETMFSNLYIIPHILGERQKKHDMWHGSNYEELPFILDIPREVIGLWNEEAKSWAREFFYDSEVSKDRARYIEIHRELRDVGPGEKRSRLLDEAGRIQYGETYIPITERVLKYIEKEEADNVIRVDEDYFKKKKKGK